jgi:hypothetical protein
MQEIKLYKSPWKAIRLILLSLPFVIISLYFIIYDDPAKTLDWFCLCFFGLGIPLGLFNLLDRRPELVLSEDGIFDRLSYGIFNKRKDKGCVSWNCIKNVYVKVCNNSFHDIPTSKQRYICIEVSVKEKTKPKYNTKASKFSHVLGLSDYNIPLMNLKVDDKKLLEFITSMSHADASTRQSLLLTSVL